MHTSWTRSQLHELFMETELFDRAFYGSRTNHSSGIKLIYLIRDYSKKLLWNNKLKWFWKLNFIYLRIIFLLYQQIFRQEIEDLLTNLFWFRSINVFTRNQINIVSCFKFEKLLPENQISKEQDIFFIIDLPNDRTIPKFIAFFSPSFQIHFAFHLISDIIMRAEFIAVVMLIWLWFAVRKTPRDRQKCQN